MDLGPLVRPMLYELNDTLFVLQVSHLLGTEDISPTFIQRVLYLCAALAPEAGLAWPYSFTNLPFGPYNGNVASAITRLVAFGYALPSSVSIVAPGQVRARYNITPNGEKQVEQLLVLDYERRRQ